MINLLLCLLITTTTTTNASSMMLRRRMSSQRQIFAYPQSPPEDAFPLGLCVGDCDNDSDCMDGYYCFQRDPNGAIPGCIGGETDNSRTDYCTDGAETTIDPTPGPTVSPTHSTTSSPTPGSTPVVTSSPTPGPSSPPSVPPTSLPVTSPPSTQGFTGSPTPPPSKTSTSSPTMSPTPEPTTGPSPGPSVNVNPTPSPSESTMLPAPGFRSIPKPKIYPLGQCEGDCLWHEDCDEGMFCYQRDPYEAIPGCLGGETDGTRTDYCTYSPPIVAPVEPPTADNFRIKMYWDNYYWQEEDFDRVWCMQCKDGCQEGEVLFLHYCAWDSARFDFVDIPGSNNNSTQIRVVDTDLCLEGSQSTTSLQLCDVNKSPQQWTATGGTSFDDDFFEFSQLYDGEDHCATTHHHPKYGEEIELYLCSVARNDDTSFWTKY